MANIHLIGGEKGGVGKSLVSRLRAQFQLYGDDFEILKTSGLLEPAQTLKLGILERRRVRSWLKNAYEAPSHVNP
jgi:hypothetical protein